MSPNPSEEVEVTIEAPSDHEPESRAQPQLRDSENPAIQRALRRLRETQEQRSHTAHHTHHSSHSTHSKGGW
jgi:hypothetical protein